MPFSPAWAPYCGPGPAPAELMGRWNLDPLLLAVLAGLTAFAWWRGMSRGPLLAAGMVALFIFVSPLCAASSALFSARTIHHVFLLAALAPAMALLQPVREAKGLWLWTALQAAAFWAWHTPAAYGWALSSDAIYWLMQVTLLAPAVMFWRAVFGAGALSGAGSLAATMVQMGLLGALITFADRPLYAPHLLTTLSWGLAPIEDQQLAGLIMWAPAALIYLLAALFRVGHWLAAEEQARTPA